MNHYQIIKPAQITAPICALVPIQEIEAWIMADMNAIKKVITSWDYEKDIPRPEAIASPKEHLEKISRQNQNQKPRYSHATHNEKIAEHLDLNVPLLRLWLRWLPTERATSDNCNVKIPVFTSR